MFDIVQIEKTHSQFISKTKMPYGIDALNSKKGIKVSKISMIASSNICKKTINYYINLYYSVGMNKFERQRKELVNVLREEGIKDKKVLDAIFNVSRHLFVPKEFLDVAYGNYPLQIGEGQTISQPYTVAFMLQALELKKGDKVLEIGTGSGWNAALIAEIVKPGMVYTTEINPALMKLSKRNIAKLNLRNICVIETDGSMGYEKEAPYDKIIVTAAAPMIIKQWTEQLKEDGIIVAPVGGLFEQKMIKAKKINGKIVEEELGYFRFVPLKGKYGYE